MTPESTPPDAGYILLFELLAFAMLIALGGVQIWLGVRLVRAHERAANALTLLADRRT